MLLLVALCIATIIGSRSIASESNLSELNKLKAESFKLKTKLAQCQATVNDRENRILSYELSNEQAKLVEEFRKQMDPKKEYIFDWDSLSFRMPSQREKVRGTNSSSPDQ